MTRLFALAFAVFAFSVGIAMPAAAQDEMTE